MWGVLAVAFIFFIFLRYLCETTESGKKRKWDQLRKQQNDEDEVMRIKKELDDLLEKYPSIWNQPNFALPWGPNDADVNHYRKLLKIALSVKESHERT